jgi:branched-subunit amino acid transport protein AzlD
LTNIDTILIILVASFATILTRFLPFIIFKKREKPSKLLLLFENIMPLMIMVILVFYTIKADDFFESNLSLAKISAIVLTIILHLKFKNLFLSITLSTIFYMYLVQFIL